MTLPRIADLIDETCKMTGFTPAEIKGMSRQKSYARARFAICYVAHRHLGKTCRQIGNVLGGKDWTSVRHAKRRAEELLGKDKALTEVVQVLTGFVQSCEERRAA